jgi:hypothetical protein
MFVIYCESLKSSDTRLQSQQNRDNAGYKPVLNT